MKHSLIQSLTRVLNVADTINMLLCLQNAWRSTHDIFSLTEMMVHNHFLACYDRSI